MLRDDLLNERLDLGRHSHVKDVGGHPLATSNCFVQHPLTKSSDDDVVSRIMPSMYQGLPAAGIPLF
ncbi:hypothetical protein [Caballeronia sordidicola]|uniref:Uncharacterized protein n=1 Tax=Caballeronia sordidicola TaxID=196367 RepID=A0A226WS46_CABSO|nr:hypothetical protein [Caballeronia sordidicola]OXC73438.1 hypothetical protein BSU04_36945 [Caballeronia sordidicola]